MRDGLRAREAIIYMVDEVKPDGSIPGLQERPEILLFVDEAKMALDGVSFEYRPDRGTWVTQGQSGVLHPWFFRKVVDMRPGRLGNVLFQSKDDPDLACTKTRAGRTLVHGTYWGSVYGILKQGLQPARMPRGARGEMSSFLQSAEARVHVTPMSATPSDMVKRIDGLDLKPDVLIVIEGANLEVEKSTQSSTVFVPGSVPRELITKAVSVSMGDISDDLSAKIEDPRDFEAIPIIDLEAPEAVVVEQMRYACEVVGFLTVVNHGVDPELEARMKNAQVQFFDKSQVVKDELRMKPGSVRGYFGAGDENLEKVGDAVSNGKKKGLKDLKEGLDMNGADDSCTCMWNTPGPYADTDVEVIAAEYALAQRKLATRIMRLVALAFGLEEDFYTRHMDKCLATLRLLHYGPPDFSEKQGETVIGAGAHTDYGLITVLKQDNIGGLQVLNWKEQCWVHAYPVPDSYVINFGDVLQMWSEGKVKSTIHRVVHLQSSHRYSAPYFVAPNHDTVVTPDGAPVMTSEDVLMARYTSAGLVKKS
jgi:isopenicillin N synthase-like dioxygenase